MIYVNTEGSNFLSNMRATMVARGLDCSAFSAASFVPDKFTKNVFVEEREPSEKILGNNNLYAFLKQNGFSRAVIIKLNCEAFTVHDHLNGAITEVCLPFKEHLHDQYVNFFIHYAIEILTQGEPNLPCENSHSANLVKLFRKISDRDVTVLVNGPTGTGKEVMSNLLHAFSDRKAGPFIAVNCAAIPEQMLESTLFGHEKGAFTGALQQNVGLFKAADGGTILLDEISEMPLSLQSKLLRVLQEKRVMSVGGSAEVAVDTRIVATTNRNMTEEVKTGRFREDLYYRLNVFPVDTMALSERIDDIVPISAHFLFKLDKQRNTYTCISSDAIDALQAHNWPGNARELGNVIHRAHILASRNQITSADLIFDLVDGVGSPNTANVLASKLRADAKNEVQL